MGEHFLRRQAHGFRHRHDAAFDRMKIPNLISATRQDVMTREFRCDGGDAPEAGAQVPKSSFAERMTGSLCSSAVASSGPSQRAKRYRSRPSSIPDADYYERPSPRAPRSLRRSSFDYR
jgi:hypothetical protein